MTNIVRARNAAEFTLLLESLSSEIVDAHIHFKLNADLHETYGKFPRAREQSNTFWYLTERAHVATCVGSLCRIYDQDGKSLHLHSLLCTIKDNLGFFSEAGFRERLTDNPFVGSLAESFQTPDPATLEQDIQLCSRHDPLVVKLIRLRGNHIAHSNAKYVVSQRQPKEVQGMTEDEIRKLLARAKDIVNRYSSMFVAATYSTQIIGHDDFVMILRSVQESVDRQDADWHSILEAHTGGDRKP